MNQQSEQESDTRQQPSKQEIIENKMYRQIIKNMNNTLLNFFSEENMAISIITPFTSMFYEDNNDTK